MITQADDFPIHQTPEPIAFPIGERNFYDRYFFNGYSEDGSTFFGVALGFYPQLGIVDAAFSVRRDGVQRNVRASREAGVLDRMDLSVGPISVTVVRPLRTLKVRVDHEIVQATLEFNARCPIVQEPRFTRRAGGRLVIDYTRMTQNGAWSGDIAIEGHTFGVEGDWGTRDRSWGIRPVGPPDSQPADAVPQFFWLWTPLNFEDGGVLYHLNADAEGQAWNESGAILPALTEQTPGLAPEDAACPSARSEIDVDPDTRRLRSASLCLERRRGPLEIDLEIGEPFYMTGLGYMHPTWGHGHRRGALDIGYDEIDLDAVAEDTGLLHRHIQSFCIARVRGGGEVGRGVVEQLFLGEHRPLGLRPEAPPGRKG